MTRFRHLAIAALALAASASSAFAHIPRDVLNPTLSLSPLRVHSPACAGVTADRCSFVVLFLDAHGDISAMDIEAGLLPVVTPGVMRLKQNAADELTAVQTKANPGVQGWNAATPTHDAEGNLTSDGTLTLTYDYENRLVTATGTTHVVSRYAGDGSRVARFEDGTTRIHVLDHGAGQDAVLMTLDTNGVPVRYYVWAGSLAAHVDAGGAVRYYHADHQSTTLALSDGNGAVTDQWFISPYGEQMNRTGATGTPYIWIGGRAVWNEGNSLYRMQARHYHMGLKRWIARDPIGMGGGANLYAYALGSPLLLYDPWGLCAEAWYQRDIIPGSSLQDMGMYASHGAHGLLRSPVDMVVGAYRGVQGIGSYFGHMSAHASGTWDATVNTVQSLPQTVPTAVNNWANDPQAIGSTVGQIGIGIGATKVMQGLRGTTASSGKPLYRYMSQAEADDVMRSGVLRGGRPGQTYWTDSRFTSGARAQNRLSLPDTPEVRMEFQLRGNPSLQRAGTRVTPDYGGLGGGREYMSLDPVNVEVINVQPFTH